MKYFVFAFALMVLGGLLTGQGDAMVSSKMINIASAVQVECNRRSTTIGGVNVGCRGFADVRKIQMREDNRTRSVNGKNIVQIRN